LKSLSFALGICLAASLSFGSTLPGFRVERIASTSGFASSVAVDSQSRIYYTTTGGDLYRLDAGVSNLIAHVKTIAIGDSGLLGMALRDDHTAVVHYTNADVSEDVISLVDLDSGRETILHRFICDLSFPGRPTSPEHHGGNPTVAPDGSIFVAIGDYGGGAIATLPEWNGGKVWHIFPDGSVEQYARGFRNPFDLAWDQAAQHIVLSDNGAAVDDEINIVTPGGYYGWPFTAGHEPPIPNAIAPVYVFPTVVAPTGIVALSGRNPLLRNGYLVGSFVAKSIFYFPSIDSTPVSDPIALIANETSFIIDVTQSPSGDIYVAANDAIYRLIVPAAGDCNGDGVINAADFQLLARELMERGPHPTIESGNGTTHASWGCDANSDGVVDQRDVSALATMTNVRLRATRR
jgi:glucose/arabinose dehydrogenase